jgi:glycosyltransferase involved in cell wall biosynthesis
MPSLAGGTKSTRLICEALARRGHRVRLIYPTQHRALPPVRHVHAYVREARRRVRWWWESGVHHLVESTASLMPVCVEWIAAWPASKGVKVHYIRGHEVYHRENVRVATVYRMPIAKVVISHWLQRVMREQYGCDAVVVPNGVDRRQFDAPPREPPEVATVGFVYAPGVLKGAATAAEAIRLVRRELPDTRVRAFGASRIDNKDRLPSDLEYLLRPKQQEIASIYRSASCWVVPSLSEGLGMPGLEAAACRCPLVVTRCGGPEDYVREGVNGFVVSVGDPGEMATAILRVLRAPRDEWRRMSEASHRIARGFDWDASAEQLELLFGGLIEGVQSSGVVG